MDLARCGGESTAHSGRALHRSLGNARPHGDRSPSSGAGADDPAVPILFVLGKGFEGTIRLGVATDTYDCDGDPIGPAQEVNVTLEEISAVASGFVGVLQQTPPSFSAKKIKGVT